MKEEKQIYHQIAASIPKEIKAQAELSLAISRRIAELMQQRGLTKKQFAVQLERRPSEVTKWLSGQHNFTIGTLAMLSTFFGQPIICVTGDVKTGDDKC